MIPKFETASPCTFLFLFLVQIFHCGYLANETWRLLSAVGIYVSLVWVVEVHYILHARLVI